MAQELYQQGLARAKSGDRYGAIQFFSNAIATNPELANAYYQRGLILFDLGDYQGAIKDYDQVLSLNPIFLMYTSPVV